MKRIFVGVMALMMGSIAMAAPFCVENEKDFLENKDKLPKMLQKLPFYITSLPSNVGAASTKISVVEGKFRVHTFMLAAGIPKEVNGDLKKICFENDKISLLSQKFEEKKAGEKVYKAEKEDEFTITSETTLKTKVAFFNINFQKATEQEYRKRGQEIMETYGKSASESTSGAQSGAQ